MKLLLTSTGLGNKKIRDFFIAVLPRAPEECSVLMAAYAQNEYVESIYANESKNELMVLGINRIFVFNLNEEKFDDAGMMYDVIYVCGGNTFAILDRMRKTGIDGYIKKAVMAGVSFYVGVSAGSIIAGPNILTAGWGSEADGNFVGLSDLTGLQLTNVSVLPHLKFAYEARLKELAKSVDYPVIGLTDEEALLVEDSDVKKI